MGIGVGIVLIVVGLILLTGAVELPDSVTQAVDASLIGWICVLGGALALVLAMVTINRSRRTHVEEHRQL